jgi:hypothetical protein
VCAFFGFQAEHSHRPSNQATAESQASFSMCGVACILLSVAIAFLALSQFPDTFVLYLGAVAALVVDAVSVFHRNKINFQ